MDKAKHGFKRNSFFAFVRVNRLREKRSEDKKRREEEEEEEEEKRREEEEIKVWICKEFWYEFVYGILCMDTRLEV